MFDVFHNEKGRPTKNLKILIKTLKQNFKCVLNKEKLIYDKIKNAKLLVFCSPANELTPEDAEILNKYFQNGGQILIMADDGGDRQ